MVPTLVHILQTAVLIQPVLAQMELHMLPEAVADTKVEQSALTVPVEDLDILILLSSQKPKVQPAFIAEMDM